MGNLGDRWLVREPWGCEPVLSPKLEELAVPEKIPATPKRVDPKKKPIRRPDDKETSPEPDHMDPPPRDVREAPVPNPNGKPNEKRQRSFSG